MKKIKIFCLALISTLALQAQIIYVPGDYPSIQEGINAAVDGDSVLVADSLYFEQINFLGKKITVASHFLIDGDTSHISNTILDGSLITDTDSASVVYFISGEDTNSILCGFTIRHGKGTHSEAAGKISREGGGIFISLSGAKIIHNHVTQNHLNDTLPGSSEVVSGAGLTTEYLPDDHWVILDHNVFDHNSCFSRSWEASAAGFAISYNARISYNTISDNTCIAELETYATTPAFFAGTDDAWSHDVTINIHHNIIKNNLCENPDYWASAPAGGFQACTGIFSDNEVTGNVCTTWQYSGGGGFLILNPREGIVVRNNVFQGNTTNKWTGALHLEVQDSDDVPLVLVENNYFLYNESEKGGAFTTLNVPVNLINNVFNGNHASQLGGALYLDEIGDFPGIHFAFLANNIFSNNVAVNAGGAILSTLYANPLILNCVFWNDSASYANEIYVSSGLAEIAYTCVDEAGVMGTTIIGPGVTYDDPVFMDSLYLVPEHWSPCVDNGIDQYACQHGDTFYAPLTDINGVPRPVGAGYDIGAYDQQFWGVGLRGIMKEEMRITNYPNPFSGSTTFTYRLNEASEVLLQVFNSQGQMVAVPVNSKQTRGEQKIEWNAAGMPAGVYHYRIEVDGRIGSGKTLKTE